MSSAQQATTSTKTTKISSPTRCQTMHWRLQRILRGVCWPSPLSPGAPRRSRCHPDAQTHLAGWKHTGNPVYLWRVIAVCAKRRTSLPRPCCSATVSRAPSLTKGDAIRQIGVSEVTYYRWRQEFGGLKIEQVKRLKDLELENSRLRKAVSDLTLDKLILQEAARGNF